MAKRRVTITVDAKLLAEAALIVERGEFDSLSAWVSQAIDDRLDHERRRSALDDLVDQWERESGEFTDEQLASRERADRDAAAAVRAETRRAG